MSVTTRARPDMMHDLATACAWAAGAYDVLISTGEIDRDVSAALILLHAGRRVVLRGNHDPEAVRQTLAMRVPKLWDTRLFLLGDKGVFRMDACCASPMDLAATPPTVPMARDFAGLLAARRMLRRKSPATDDYGRAAAARWIAAHSVPPLPEVVQRKQGCSARWFTPPNAQNAPVIYLHGGGLVHYDLDVFSPMLSHLAQGIEAPILAIGYDKCPETPAADVIDGLMYNVADMARAFGVKHIMGDSIGGLLALYAAHRAADTQFQHVSMIYPVLSLQTSFGSYERFGEGRLLDQSDMRWFRSLIGPTLRARGFDPLRLPRGSFGDLNLRVFSGGQDVLSDEAQAFVNKHDCGGMHFADLPHDFCLYAPRLASARHAMTAIIQTLRNQERPLNEH
jgi:acetyl esterase/lipase